MRLAKASILLLLAGVLAASALLLGCTPQDSRSARLAPAVGEWSSECKLADMDLSDLTGLEKLVANALSDSFRISFNVQFVDDGTFSYNIDRESVRGVILNAISWLGDAFIGVDPSSFIEKLMDKLLLSIMHDKLNDHEFGTYNVSDSVISAATESGKSLSFRLIGGKLVQLSSDGSDLMVFSKVEKPTT